MHIQNAVKVILSLFLIFSCTSVFAKFNNQSGDLLHLKMSAAPLQDFNGKKRSLSEYIDASISQGKWQVVMLWSSYCGVSKDEMHNYVSFHEKNKTSDISFIGVSLDGDEGKESAQAFMKTHAMSFINLIGDDETLSRYFLSDTGEALSTPSFLLYSPDGELMASQVGAIPPELISNFIKSNKVTVSRK